jgi:hypothetical protein
MNARIDERSYVDWKDILFLEEQNGEKKRVCGVWDCGVMVRTISEGVVVCR